MDDTFTTTIIVTKPVSEVFSRWMDFERFPDFMENVVSVQCMNDTASHWVVKGPMGQEIEWSAETTLLEPNKRVGWKASGDAVKTSGQITFTNLPNNSTQLTVTIHYVPTGGIAGTLATQLFGNVQERVESDLRNFKRHCEETHDRLPAHEQTQS
jgi:uncharacterized membrane protein